VCVCVCVCGVAFVSKSWHHTFGFIVCLFTLFFLLLFSKNDSITAMEAATSDEEKEHYKVFFNRMILNFC
jgi:hypothetical protein